ncbi:MAG: hypothetical protein ABL961_12820 [Vicinamibacterales bacterium]
MSHTSRRLTQTPVLGLGRFVYLRLRRALLPDFERRWSRDIDSSLSDVHRKLSAMEAELAELRAFKRRMTLDQWLAHSEPQRERVRQISLSEVEAHIARAIAATPVVGTPTTHMVVEDVLPAEVYELLTAAIPPADLFPDRDPVKRDFEMSALGTAPPLTQDMWRLFDEDIVRRIVAPLVFARFQSAVETHYADTGGEAFGRAAAAIPHRTVAGRIQLRRPGYTLKPHLDPKRVVITGLFYFPRPGDADAYGTQLFTIDRPVVHHGMTTFFPEQAGAVCTLASTVPYRRNSMLVFVNSRAAHGASLPADATLDERYAYQFYVKPLDGDLKKLLKTLPEAARAAWDEIL